MKTSKLLVLRALDAAVIAALLVGSSNAKTFAFWMISFVVITLALGVFAVDRSAAEKICGQTPMRRVCGVLVNIAYVAALVYAGFPILAAVYASVTILLRTVAQAKLAEGSGHD